EERVSSLLAVGDHVEPRRLLKRHRLVHGPVLHPLELRRPDPPLLEILPSAHELRRPQETPDDITPNRHTSPHATKVPLRAPAPPAQSRSWGRLGGGLWPPPITNIARTGSSRRRLGCGGRRRSAGAGPGW